MSHTSHPKAFLGDYIHTLYTQQLHLHVPGYNIGQFCDGAQCLGDVLVVHPPLGFLFLVLADGPGLVAASASVPVPSSAIPEMQKGAGFKGCRREGFPSVGFSSPILAVVDPKPC